MGASTYCSPSGNQEGAVRFGLNVNLSSVIYASDASDTSSTSSGFKSLTSSNGYRLTLLDDTRNTFTSSLSQNVISRLPGESVTINYQNAQTTEGECITVLIKDGKTGEAKCYSRYPVSSANGSINVILPHDDMLAFGTYELLVMNERVGEAYYTNYASPATKLTLMICDEESPMVTNVYTNAANTMFRLTAKDNYKLDKITTMKNNMIHEYVLDNTYVPGTSITQRFNSTCNMDSFKVYDTGGNAAEVLAPNIITDDAGPRVESITYDGGNYTIRVSDSQSGIWKITNSTGDVIYQRYDGITSS